MNTRITAIIIHQGKQIPIDLFGYCNKGIPGLEITGLGKIGKTIKEKFIYLTRAESLQLPMKRFVLCVELPSNIKEQDNEILRWLELPLLILFWSLAGHLPISRLDDCLCLGKINISGQIEQVTINQTVQTSLKQQHIQKELPGPKIIQSYALPLPEECLEVIGLEELFGAKKYFSFFETTTAASGF